jgi:hypothetical protein
MKLSSIIASLLLTVLSASAFAAADRTYYVTELAPQQKFDVYNDGRNTFLQSIPGLIVTGATADGEFFIVKGVPSSIRGFMNGKPITVVRGLPPAPRPVAPDPAAVDARIKALTDKLDSLTSKASPGAVAAMGAGTSLAGAAGTAAPQGGAAARAGGIAGGIAGDTGATPGQRPTPAVRQIPSINDVHTYRAVPADQNLRILTERWSRVVGWTAIWDVDKDIPIGTAGEKAADYKTAIRWLLASTEFGDVVVKPCFYSNSVVRIVRKTVKCNPNE